MLAKLTELQGKWFFLIGIHSIKVQKPILVVATDQMPDHS